MAREPSTGLTRAWPTAAIARWFQEKREDFPPLMVRAFEKVLELPYGENPHQRAAYYAEVGSRMHVLSMVRQLGGKELSFNNLLDLNGARSLVDEFDIPACAIIKHNNPCGCAVGSTALEAYQRAFAGDPTSAFGGVIAANREVDLSTAEQIAEVFTEVVVAPSFTDDAVRVLTGKKNIRLLRLPHLPGAAAELRPISGGLLLQATDRIDAPGDDPTSWTLATGEPLSEAGLADLAFAWRACRAVKSNAILLARDGATVGVGMGQVNRVDSAKLAVARAGAERAAGSFAASDAFFPFPDGLEVLTEAGVKAVAQPGGSIRDEAVVEAARKAGVTMYLTGTRHFFH